MGKEFKHTQGPWKVVEAYQYELSCPMFSIQKDEGQSDSILLSVAAVFTGKDATESDQANAKLIAAAPELLKMLIEILDSPADLVPGQRDKAIRVIQKATA